MDLSPEEQSFFDAGDAIVGPPPQEPQGQSHRRHRSRRHSHRHSRPRFRGTRTGRVVRAVMAGVLMIGAVGAGYWVSMYVINRGELVNPNDFGVESR